MEFLCFMSLFVGLTCIIQLLVYTFFKGFSPFFFFFQMENYIWSRADFRKKKWKAGVISFYFSFLTRPSKIHEVPHTISEASPREIVPRWVFTLPPTKRGKLPKDYALFTFALPATITEPRI